MQRSVSFSKILLSSLLLLMTNCIAVRSSKSDNQTTSPKVNTTEPLLSATAIPEDFFERNSAERNRLIGSINARLLFQEKQINMLNQSLAEKDKRIQDKDVIVELQKDKIDEMRKKHARDIEDTEKEVNFATLASLKCYLTSIRSKAKSFTPTFQLRFDEIKEEYMNKGINNWEQQSHKIIWRVLLQHSTYEVFDCLRQELNNSIALYDQFGANMQKVQNSIKGDFQGVPLCKTLYSQASIQKLFEFFSIDTKDEVVSQLHKLITCSRPVLDKNGKTEEGEGGGNGV